MSGEAGIEVVVNGASTTEDSVVTIERRRPWFVAAIVVAALVALVGVSLATRSGNADEEADDEPPPSSIAPSTTTTSQAPERDQPSTTIEPASAPPADTVTIPAPAGADGTGTIVELLPADIDVLAALPEGGIDGWIFAVNPQNVLTRTDLTTGEQQQVTLDTSNDFVLDQFGRSGFNGLVQVGDQVAIALQSDVFIIDIETLSVTRVELEIGDRPSITAHDDNTLWLQFLRLNEGPRISFLTSLSLETLELGEPILIDPIGIGFGVAGASNGVLRYHVPFVGSWEVANGSSRRLPDPILAGGGRGTIELRCSDISGDCQTVIYDIATQTENPIELGVQVFGMSVSPDLQWVATADGHLINIDGTVIDLPTTSAGQIDGVTWTWSTTGRFVTDSNYRVFDTTGQIESFELPTQNGFGLVVGSVLVERSVDETVKSTDDA